MLWVDLPRERRKGNRGVGIAYIGMTKIESSIIPGCALHMWVMVGFERGEHRMKSPIYILSAPGAVD